MCYTDADEDGFAIDTITRGSVEKFIEKLLSEKDLQHKKELKEAIKKSYIRGARNMGSDNFTKQSIDGWHNIQIERLYKRYGVDKLD